MKFNIYAADVTGVETNTLYPHRYEVETPNQLAEALAKDNVACKFRNNYRHTDNIEDADCVVMDFDNDHTEVLEEMLTKEKLSARWPDVAMAVAPSRNNMKPKNGKMPRPKGHVVFPIKPTANAEYIAALKRGIRKACPLFDMKCLDAPHFIYGAEMTAEDILWQEGWITIDEIIDPVYETDEKTPARGSAGGTIPIGERNGTLSQFAAKILKRFGDTDYAHQAFRLRAEQCEEPLSEKELNVIWRSAQKFFHTKVESSAGYESPDEYNDEFSEPGCLRPSDFTDVSEARMFAKEYGDIVAHTTATDFLCYDGRVWDESNARAMMLLMEFLDMQLIDAMHLCAVTKQALLASGVGESAIEAGGKRAMKDLEGEQLKLFMDYLDAKSYYAFVMKYRDMKHFMATLQAAKAILDVPISDFDSDPYLLNTLDGTLDLRKGMSSLREHDPADRITKITAVAPSDEGKDLWLDQLEKTFMGNAGIIEYTQATFGEAAFGQVENERLLIGYGGGRNGKSTVCNSMARTLGTYAGVISSDVLTAGVKRNVKPEIAEIKGKRLLIAGELEEGMRLSTAIVKQLCSTDPIKGEKKYKKPFDFIPSHSLILYTNHLPKVGAIDDGIWRRLVVIPFNAKFEGKSDIKNYTEYLAEHAGEYILKWLIEGAEKAYRADFKTKTPPEVQAAIDKYRQDNDWFTHFLDERCEVGADLMQRSGEFYAAYREYCAASGDYIRDSATFYTTLEQKGFTKKKKSDGSYIFGLHLKEEEESVPF